MRSNNLLTGRGLSEALVVMLLMSACSVKTSGDGALDTPPPDVFAHKLSGPNVEGSWSSQCVQDFGQKYRQRKVTFKAQAITRIDNSYTDKACTQAFQFWKSEFALNSSFKKASAGYANIATQDFNYLTKCKEQTPLIFKLGIKALNEEEIKYLGDPKKFIGVTIRKSYSLDSLQGDGIIYITADKGADAYNNNGQLTARAWKSPQLMQYALIHELGHFFGIPHVGSGLMSEVFMSVLLNKQMSGEFEAASQLSFLNPQNDFEVCRSSNNFNPDFFGVPPGTTCLKFERASGANLGWDVSRKLDSETAADSQYERIGLVQVTSLDQSPSTLKPAVIVQLPDEQKVFSAVETILGPFLIGAIFSDTSYNGSFRPIKSVRAYPLQMSLSAEKISFVGTVNNQQMTVMNYSPLSFMRAIFPF